MGKDATQEETDRFPYCWGKKPSLPEEDPDGISIFVCARVKKAEKQLRMVSLFWEWVEITYEERETSETYLTPWGS